MEDNWLRHPDKLLMPESKCQTQQEVRSQAGGRRARPAGAAAGPTLREQVILQKETNSRIFMLLADSE